MGEPEGKGVFGGVPLQVPSLMMDSQFSEFTPDITPIMLAAHTNNYEIIKLLVQRKVRTLRSSVDGRVIDADVVCRSRSPFLGRTRSAATAWSVCPAPRSVLLSGRRWADVSTKAQGVPCSPCRSTAFDIRGLDSTSTKLWRRRRSSRCPVKIRSSPPSDWAGNSRSSAR